MNFYMDDEKWKAFKKRHITSCLEMHEKCGLASNAAKLISILDNSLEFARKEIEETRINFSGSGVYYADCCGHRFIGINQSPDIAGKCRYCREIYIGETKQKFNGAFELRD